MQTGKLTEYQTIVVTGNKISDIGHDGEVALPDGARFRDASGQYVIPGLWDMHVHLERHYEHAFPLFLGNGITGIREMGSAMGNIDL